MATPSLFPIFLKAQEVVVGGGGAGTVFIETLETEIMSLIDVEVVDDPIDVEILEEVDVEVVEDPIDVEVDC